VLRSRTVLGSKNTTNGLRRFNTSVGNIGISEVFSSLFEPNILPSHGLYDLFFLLSTYYCNGDIVYYIYVLIIIR